MKHLVLMTAVALSVATPSLADGAETPPVDDGFSLMERGAQLLFEGLLKEMEPAMEDLKSFADEIEPGLRQFVQEMGPAMAELIDKIDDFSNYEQPEFLPNGDIIIRRKPEAEPFDPNKDEIEI